MLFFSVLIQNFYSASATPVLSDSPTIDTSIPWRAMRATTMPYFQLRSVDDSSWPNATSQAKYGDAPWTNRVIAPAGAPADISLNGSTWIWSDEKATVSAPAEPRAFRRTFVPPAGKVPVSSDVVVTADNQFVLYVNGAKIGASANASDNGGWQNAQYFPAITTSGTSILFAILGTNNADATTTPAGLIATIKVSYKDGTSDIIRTDSLWKVDKEIPADFQIPATTSSSSLSSSTASASTTGKSSSITKSSSISKSSATRSSTSTTATSTSSTSSSPSKFVSLFT